VFERRCVQVRQVLPVENVFPHAFERRANRPLVAGDPDEFQPVGVELRGIFLKCGHAGYSIASVSSREFLRGCHRAGFIQRHRL